MNKALISTELVAVRTGLRPFQHGHQSKHCADASPPQCPSHSQIYPLDHFLHHRDLQRFLLLRLYLPVHSLGILLDSTHWWTRLLSGYFDHRCCYLWLLRNHLCWRPCLLNPAGPLGVVPPDGPQREDCSYRYFVDGCYVSMPVPFWIQNRPYAEQYLKNCECCAPRSLMTTRP